MNEFSLKDTLVKHAKTVKEKDLSNFIKENDLFYSIYSLHLFIKIEVERKVKKESNELLFYNLDKLAEILNYNINLQIRNHFINYILVHEIKIAREAEFITSDNSKSELQQYILLTSNWEWIEYIFEKYKYLDNRLTKYLNNIFKNLDNILVRIAHDIHDINIFLGQTNQKIKLIELFLGDLHQSGQCVSKVVFDTGNIVLYKPRNQSTELELNKILNFFSALGEIIPIKIPSIISKGEYCWVEFIQNIEISKQEDINTFFYNHGKALALFHLLGSTDLIADNIIAQGFTPAYIDLECILSKQHPVEEYSDFYSAFENSVLATSILPCLALGDSFERDYFSGALHSLSDKKIKTEVWENQDSSKIGFTKKDIFRIESANERHLPLYQGKRCEISEIYLAPLLAGFTDLYKFIQLNKSKLIDFITTERIFADSYFRVIPHPTALYGKLSQNFFIPESFQNLKNEKDVRKILIRNFSFKSQKINRGIANSVIEQLKEGDIPFFYSYANSNSLYTHGDNVVVQDYFSEAANSQESIISRIAKMSEKEYTLQRKIIKGTIEFYLHLNDNLFRVDDHTRHLNFESSKKNGNKLLDGVIAIADFFILNGIEIEREINWLAKTTNSKDENYEYLPLPYDLYEGLSGIAFFLLYAYKYSRNERYLHFAENILNNEKRIFRSQVKKGMFKKLSPVQKRYFSVSPFYYPFSILFIMEHFTGIDDRYFDEEIVEECLDLYNEIVDDIESWDILKGLAGILELLLSLSKRSKSGKIKSVIRKTIDRLIAKSITKGEDSIAWNYQHLDSPYDNLVQFGGYAHGTAGIALTLFRASAEVEDNNLKKYAIMALNYDRSLFSERDQNWLDLRDQNDLRDSSSWCHGSSGIAMSRALMTQYSTDPMLTSEIKIAVKNILSSKSQSECLCHGQGSNLEILKICSSVTNDNHLKEHVLNKINELNEKVLSNTFQMTYGDGNKMEMLGLFLGLAGVGYTLLRFHDWETMPSVLCLESSMLNYQIAHRP